MVNILAKKELGEQLGEPILIFESQQTKGACSSVG
tara:strand:- start:24 stop:128 length:105 start_codon:yes stop_codon:yes gene_type:complete